ITGAEECEVADEDISFGTAAAGVDCAAATLGNVRSQRMCKREAESRVIADEEACFSEFQASTEQRIACTSLVVWQASCCHRPLPLVKRSSSIEYEANKK